MMKPTPEKGDEVRQKAMQTRVENIGSTEKPEAEQDAYDDFDIVHELVSEAYGRYAEEEDKDLASCLMRLSGDIRKVALEMDSTVTDDEDEEVYN